jgi:small multidrug resistance pump
VTLMGAVVFGQSLDGYALLGISLILAGVIVLNALSTSASG